MKRLAVSRVRRFSFFAPLLLVLLVGLTVGPPDGNALFSDHGPEAAIDPAPTPFPDRVILTWSGDPATSQAVTWRTDDSVEKAYAEIALADRSPDFHEEALRVTAATTPLDTESGTAHYHSARFTGLEPVSYTHLTLPTN